MNSERIKQVEEIYHAALEISPAERESFFKDHCGARKPDNFIKKKEASFV